MNIQETTAAIFGRVSLFIIYFWFGFLKLIDTSAANPLVADLLERTLPFVTFGQFIILLGVGEIIIGILFLIPRLTKIATILFALHMFTTFMPLVVLPVVAWQKFMVPTLEGQYIFKNLALISIVLFLLKKKN